MDWRTQHCKDVNSPLKANNKQNNPEEEQGVRTYTIRE